jgi:hypothetical protein
MAVTFLLTLFALLPGRTALHTANPPAQPSVRPQPPETKAAALDPPAQPEAAALVPRPSIALSVHNQHRLDRIQGNVQNETSHPLTVLLVGKDRDGQVTDQKLIELQAGAETFFGTDNGMTLVAGGSVVARVPGESDKEVKIAL